MIASSTDAGRPGRQLALVGVLLASIAALPLVPSLSPGWPRSGSLWPMILAAVLLAFALGRIWRDKPLSPRAISVLGAFSLYCLYTGNGAILRSGDTTAIRALPANILVRHTLDFSHTSLDLPRAPYAVTRVRGRLLSFFPSGTAFVALPHAALALLGSGGRVTPELLDRWEKHAAALMTVAASALIWGAARRWGDGAALGATFVFALATPVAGNAAQALWSFTGEIFCLAGALYLALRPRPLYGWAGVAAGAAFACRPTALGGAAAIGLALLATDRRGAVRYAAGLGGALAAVCAGQLALYGHALGAYGAANMAHGSLNAEFVRGLEGVLISPSRGLLVFCPWVLLLPIGLARAKNGRDPLFAWTLVSLAAAAGTLLLAAAHVNWWGGWSHGPRLATEAAPFLALASVPLFRAPRALRAAFLFLVAFAAITQLLLAYVPQALAWDPVVLARIGPRALWFVKDSQLAAAWGLPLRVVPDPPETTPGGENLWGSIDQPAEGALVTGRLHVRGWARIPGADLFVAVYLDREARMPASTVRAPRPDVCAVVPGLGDCASAGYEAAFDFAGGDGGRHELFVVFRAPDGRIRRYPARTFDWKKD